MHKLKIIDENLRNAGFSTYIESYMDDTIEVCVPRPLKKRNVKINLTSYGVFIINVNTCDLVSCRIVVESERTIPFIKDILKSHKKMISAMSKVIDIISNSKITRELAIKEINKSGCDKDVVEFLKQELWKDEL